MHEHRGGHSQGAWRVCECDHREPYFRLKTPTHRYRPCLMYTWGLGTFAFSLGVLGTSELRTKSVNLLLPRASQGVLGSQVAHGTFDDREVLGECSDAGG